MKISTLKLEWKRREGGGGKTQRDYLDFVVDGVSLSEKIGGDLVSCLGWLVPEQNKKAVNQLMLKAESDLPEHRYALYVCPECGELGCGAITAVIEKVDDTIIWRDFAFENDYDGEIQPIDEVDKFIFDRAQYRNTLRSAL